jgi:hypothetical protein
MLDLLTRSIQGDTRNNFFELNTLYLSLDLSLRRQFFALLSRLIYFLCRRTSVKQTLKQRIIFVLKRLPQFFWSLNFRNRRKFLTTVFLDLYVFQYYNFEILNFAPAQVFMGEKGRLE